jgi:hypothetical protein
MLTSLPQEKAPLDTLIDTAALIGELTGVQLERLSAILPAHFSQILAPNDHEMELASQIQTNLLEMASAVKPGDVVPQVSILSQLVLTDLSVSP